jgi:hypothetical protein
VNAGTQLQKIIQNAIDGDDKEEFGSHRIFNLSPTGCNLKIKVEKNDGGYPTYVSSKFMSASEVEGLDDPDEVYGQFKTLDTIFQQRSYDEIRSLMNTHFFGKDEEQAEVANSPKEEDDDSEVEVKAQEVSSNDNSLSEQDKKMQEILKGL